MRPPSILLDACLLAFPGAAQPAPAAYLDGYAEVRPRLVGTDERGAEAGPGIGLPPDPHPDRRQVLPLPEETRLKMGLAGGAVMAIAGWPGFIAALRLDDEENPFGVGKTLGVGLFGPLAIGGTVLATYSGVQLSRLQKRKGR